MKKLLFSISILMVLLMIIGCSEVEKSLDEENIIGSNVEKTIVDALGREVIIPDEVNRVIVTGVGALRLYSYVGDLEKLVGVEAVEHDEAIGRPYTQINHELFKSLPVIGQGGPNNTNDPEKILSVNPDVIFTTYENPDELQEKLNIPVIALSYGEKRLFDEDLYSSLFIIGDVLGNNDRAKEVVDFMIKCHDDLVRRTQDIKPESRVSAYIGGLGSRGSRGIESTQGQFIIFDVLNIKNVVDETNQKGSVMIDKEQLLVWDPEFIFIDLNGLVHVNEDYNSNPEFYQALSAYKNKNVYGQLPFNFLTTNIDTALVNTYFIGKTVYPDAFKDINAVVKADEIYTILLGEPFYEKMVRDFGGFHKIEGLQ